MIVHAANSPWLIDSPDALVQVAEQMAAAAAQAYNRMPKGMLKQQIDALPTYRCVNELFVFKHEMFHSQMASQREREPSVRCVHV